MSDARGPRIAFKPVAACGGHLSLAEVSRRSARATRQELEKLQSSEEFQAWEEARHQHQQQQQEAAEDTSDDDSRQQGPDTHQQASMTRSVEARSSLLVAVCMYTTLHLDWLILQLLFIHPTCS